MRRIEFIEMKILLLILLSMFLVTSCNKNAKTNKKTDNKKEKVLKKKIAVKKYKMDTKSILASLPKNTEAIVNLKSIETIFNNFLVTETSVFGVPFEGRDLDEMKKFLTFNPASLKDLQNLGIDTKKEIGIAFSDIIWAKGDNLSSLNVMFYLPLTDSKKALSFIESRFENGKFKGEENIKLNFKKEKDYIKIFGSNDDEVLYIFVKNNYMFITINPFNPQNSLSLTKSIIKGEEVLKDNKLFQETSKLNKTNNGIYLYGNIEEFINANKVRIEKEFSYGMKDAKLITNILGSYKSLSASLALDKKDFIMDFSAILAKDSKALAILRGIEYDNSTILGLDKSALMLMSFGINIPEYLKLIKSFMEDRDNARLDEQMDKTSKKFGINIKKDVINNLDGNFSFGSYDGMSISTTNYNTVATIGFKDGKAIKAVFDKLLQNPELKEMSKFVNKTKEEGKEIYIINAMVTQIYVGFKKNELVIASNKDMYKSAIKSSAKTGFYKYSQKDESLKEATNSEVIFYVSFLEAIKALNNFKAMLPPEPTKIAVDTLELLDYFLVKTMIGQHVVTGGYTLKTNSKKLFFPAVIDIVKKYNK